MRSALVGLGLLTALGFAVTTSAYGQVIQAYDSDSSQYQSWSSATEANHGQGVVLVDNNDPFSAGRKALGVNPSFANGGNSNNSNYRTANTSAPPFNPNGDNSTSASADGSSSGANADANVQSVFPSSS